jgi:hypothetical protein
MIGQIMEAAGRDVDRCRIVEALGDAPPSTFTSSNFLPSISASMNTRGKAAGIAAEAGQFVQNDEGVHRRP